MTLEHLTAAPVTPANGSTVAYGGGTVTLTASVPSPPEGALIIDTFEIDDNSGFTSPIPHPVPRKSTSSSTSFVLNGYLGKDVYWRVRPAAGELHGPYSQTMRFALPVEGIRPPVLLEPLDRSVQSSTPRLTLEKVAHSSNASDATWSYDFEIARDDRFGVIVASSRVVESVTGVVSFRAAELETGRYYWRARTFDGRTTSEYSAVSSFDVSEPFAAAPTPLSPAPGGSLPQSPTFVLTNGPIFGPQGEWPRYEVQLASSSSFADVVGAAWSWAAPGGVTSVTVHTSVPGGLYYWRVRAFKSKTATLPDLASPWTDARPVMLLGLVLKAPTVVAPMDNATTILRPVLTVSNAARSIPGAALVYRFEVSTDAQFAQPLAAVATVPEGVGSTSWAVPFDVAVGITMWWRVQAVEPAGGTVSPYSDQARFAAVDSQTRLYSLTLGIPASCGFRSSSPTILVQSTSAVAGPTLKLVSADASAHTADSMRLDLSISASAVSGTFVGGANAGSNRYLVSADQSGASQPVAVIGTANGSGLSGSFTGRITESTAPTYSKSCSAVTVTWSVVPRT